MTLEVPAAFLIHYVLTLARVAGLVSLMPVPGLPQTPRLPKAVLAFLLSLLLTPHGLGSADVSFLQGPGAPWILGQMILSEAALGVALGAAVGLLIEAFSLAAQILGFQAGYSFVNMVDPTTQVDASILNVFLALLSALLFFAFDLHLHLFQALAGSLDHWPLGRFTTEPRDGLMLVELGAAMFDSAVRLALPIVAVLLLIDLTLGLLNQINSRVQLLTLAFPAKIVAAIALLYPVLLAAPRLFHDLAERAFEAIAILSGR